MSSFGWQRQLYSVCLFYALPFMMPKRPSISASTQQQAMCGVMELFSTRFLNLAGSHTPFGRTKRLGIKGKTTSSLMNTEIGVGELPFSSIWKTFAWLLSSIERDFEHFFALLGSSDAHSDKTWKFNVWNQIFMETSMITAVHAERSAIPFMQ